MDSGDHGVDCSDTIGRIYHFLDGELTEERRQEIQRHLDECPPCVEAYDFEVELRQVVANRCRDRVPPTLIDRVRSALMEEERRRGSGLVPGAG
ncbi:MAG: mycothiol system anti-sigma-R factor [Actinomycetota bacterium]|jgi:mycothiol system anti-sigma-R factor|nr:mycothiol system anti-sigma-R factor [Actinomycetota bacterium]MDA8278844.1 mycothiol system anti-sigma-R factor [Actinomycetota bacterium]